MAQIPNYYFNSPYIADAARNLASALAPQDPMKLLANQKLAFEFEQEKEKARLEEKARAETEIGRSYLSQLAALEPIIGQDGKVDRAATFARARELYGNAIANRIDPKAAEVVAGPFGPGFAAKSQLAEIGADARMDLLAATMAGQRGLAEYNQGQMNARYMAGLQNQLTLQQMKGLAQFQLAVARAKNAQAGKPMKVSDSDLEMITFLVMGKEMASGKPLYDADRDRAIDESIKLFQATGNPQGAVNTVWDSTIGAQQTQHDPSAWEQLWGIDPNAGYARPDWNALSSPGATPLGTIVAPGALTNPPPTVVPPQGMTLPTPNPVTAPPPPAATRTPPASAQSGGASLPPAARAKLKEGAITTFGNGQKWTLKNGVPTQVK